MRIKKEGEAAILVGDVGGVAKDFKDRGGDP